MNDAIRSRSAIGKLGHPMAPTGGEQVADACWRTNCLPRETILVMKPKPVYRKEKLEAPFDFRHRLQAPTTSFYNLHLKM
ncbi:hypothetical protein TNCV_2517181 [Trichonephila clavipes]|nr:hypothetical protein TNCV_2517181 [Trichonephila clavipes]